MKKKAFLLGYFSIGGQVLILRELISSFNGDELLIGMALFGWLIAVAAGAFIGGLKKVAVKSGVLFVTGVILLPMTIIAVRFAPLALSGIAGEVIPLTQATIFSIILMMPVGIISGWLFPVINREGYRPSESIIRVYLYEGIGAFVGGLLLALLIGNVLSTFPISLFLGISVPVLRYVPLTKKGSALISVILILALFGIYLSGAAMDGYIDSIRYESYTVEKSFDTHYGHQTILSRGGDLYLVTDNAVESAFPDLERAENVFIPPLLFKPEAENILFIGRAEFGIMQLCDSFPGIKLTAIDPRRLLSYELNDIFTIFDNINRIDSDPVRFFRKGNLLNKYDIVILAIGEPDSYKTSRFLTPSFLSSLRVVMKDDGVLYIPAHYDTDRYILPEKRVLLSIIHSTLGRVFRHIVLWPGETTGIFASDDSAILTLSPETLMSRANNMKYNPLYLTDYQIQNRLNDIKTARLTEVIDSGFQINSIIKPVLPHYQALYRSRAHGYDTTIIPFILKGSHWLWIIPVLIVLFATTTLLKASRRRTFSLFLYFTAGLVSLTLELLSFYLYQSQAGTLYSELSALIGAFMLGLAAGTYYTARFDRDNMEYPALLLLLTAALLFASTYDTVDSGALLLYHGLFLFTVAAATGSLFTAATRRYYFGRSGANRGIGYAMDLIGSSAGALITMTILLPLIGVAWIIYSSIALVTVALAGALISS